MSRMKISCLAAVFCAASFLGAQPARRALKIDDMHRFHDVRDAQISPDGKWVAYTVNSVDAAADKSDTDVWIASWDGKQQLRMTTSTESESAPRWSPDGRWLSFLSSRPGKAKGNQVWLLDRNGGEAQQFTDVKGRLTSYEWSPDGKKLLLVMADRDPSDAADDERPGGGAAGPGAKAPKPIVIDRYKFKQDIQGYLTQPAARLYLFDVESKKAEALTEASLEAASPSWSPDGKWIAFMGALGQGCGALQHVECVCDGSARGSGAARDHEVRRSARFGFARTSRMESGRDEARVFAELRRQAGRIQHESAGCGRGGGRRAEDSGGQAGSRSFRAAFYARTALRFCSWWPTTRPNIRRAFRPMVARCSG